MEYKFDFLQQQANGDKEREREKSTYIEWEVSAGLRCEKQESFHANSLLCSAVFAPAVILIYEERSDLLHVTRGQESFIF